MSKNRREFARIDVELHARFRSVSGDEIRDLEQQLALRPSVWAPTDESRLRDLASSTAAGTDGILAQALLDVAAEIVLLRSRVLDLGGPMDTGTITQLSGGGGQLVASALLDLGQDLELRLDDYEQGLPPIRALVKVVHRRGEVPDAYGFRFEVIHARDQDRLIRFIYQLQRQAIREAQSTDS